MENSDSGYKHQLILEENLVKGKQGEPDKVKLEVKTMNDVSAGQQVLNSLFAILSALFAGFLFVFCVQIFLFLVLDLSIVSGATSINPELDPFKLVGIVLAIIGFGAFFSQAMVIAGQFVTDAWQDHPLSKTFTLKRIKNSDVMVEWLFLSLYIIIPALVAMFSLFAQSDDWWYYTAITWFVCVLLFFINFALNIVYFEVRAAWNFFLNVSDEDSDDFLPNLRRCLISRQRDKYSGKSKSNYLARTPYQGGEATDHSKRGIFQKSKKDRFSFWAKLTNILPNFLFKTLENPKELYIIDDVQDYRPYMTKNTWSLEKVFCRPTDSRFVLIVGGPGALTKGQLVSSIVCSIGTGVLIVCFLMGFLFWLGLPKAGLPFVVVLAVFFAWGPIKRGFNMLILGKDLLKAREERKTEKKEDTEDVGTSEAVYLVWDYFRVTEPHECFCWFMMLIELFVWYVWPIVVLLQVSWNLGILFIICSTAYGLRHYINITSIVKEEGTMELVGGTGKDHWENKARLNDIIRTISTNRSEKIYQQTFLFVGFVFVALLLSAVGGGAIETSATPMTYLPKQYYYERKPDNVRYPTCDLSGTGYLGFGETATMLDYGYLASAAYWNQSSLDGDLDLWFASDFGGNGTVKDEQDFVTDFLDREDPNREQAVFFRMISMPSPDSDGRLAIILIRGTVNQWDMLADAQLWSAAAMMQFLRFFIPAGEIWTPIFSELVKWTNSLVSTTINKIAFYKLTAKFAEEALKEFDHVQVTGHSLGGGLSLITGSQAKIPAIGFSAPNALISGASFDPVVTEDELNTYTFNVIPAYDIVPQLDDRSEQIQLLECTADISTAMLTCHFMTRTLCEIMATCGSGDRFAFCECHTEYGYDKPLVLSGFEDNFDELCGVSST